MTGHRASDWPFRSSVFVPGHKADWTQKALRHGPDAVLLDLEDSVPPALRADARQTVRASIAEAAAAKTGAFVRINSIETGGLNDAEAVATAGLTGVMLPKAGSADEIRALHDRLSYAEGAAGLPHLSIAIIPIPETARGICDARTLAAASPRVKGIMTGVTGTAGDETIFAGDIALAAGFRPTAQGFEQHYMLSKIAVESRAGGAHFPICGIIGNALDDLDSLRALIMHAKAFGFTGAVVMHPSHIAVANDVFTPSMAQIAFARGLLDAMREAEARGDGAARYRNMMIDYAVVAVAKDTLAEAARRGLIAEAEAAA